MGLFQVFLEAYATWYWRYIPVIYELGFQTYPFSSCQLVGLSSRCCLASLSGVLCGKWSFPCKGKRKFPRKTIERFQENLCAALTHKLAESRCFGLDRWKRDTVHTWVRVRLNLKLKIVFFRYDFQFKCKDFCLF